MFTEILNYAIPYVIGFVAIIVGRLVITDVMDSLWTNIGRPNKTRRAESLSMILGLIESVMYVVALKIGVPQFIVAWLGLKTVFRWRHWDLDVPMVDDNGNLKGWILGRDAYNLFLIGNALVLVFAGAGWKLIDHAINDAWSHVIAVILALLLGSFALIAAARCSRSDPLLASSDPRLAQNNNQK